MTNNPLISVIIPIYNVEKYLDKCMECVLNQTYKNLEIILVNDGSTDQCGKMCDEFAKKDSRIKVIHKTNGGLVNARKTGVLKASGEYVSYVDPDDWIDLNMYEVLLKRMGYESPDVMCFGFYKEYPKYSECRKEYLKPGVYYLKDAEHIVTEFLKSNDYFFTPIIGQTVWSKLFKTEIIKEKQLEVDEKIRVGEDCVSYACILNSNKIMILEECPYHYRVNEKSMVHDITQEDYERYISLAKYLKSLVTENSFYRPLITQSLYYHILIIATEKLIVSGEDISILYPEIKKNSRVVIYGKGVIAKSINKAIENNNYFKIVKWVDSSSIDELLQMDDSEYDYIVIAIGVSQIVRKVEVLLDEKGIDSDKVLRIKSTNLSEERLPEEIFNN